MTEATFEIASVSGGARLSFSGSIQGQARANDGYTITVRLHGGGVDATARVYDHPPARWTRLFQQMAREWRGWQGHKSEESLEGHLRLSVCSDCLGHVSMRVELSGGTPESDWRAAETVHLEAGQLDDLAKRARAYFGEDR